MTANPETREGENLAFLARHGLGHGADPDLIADEYRFFVQQAIRAHPRSQQRRIGPSEIGHPCARRVGYKLLDVDEVNTSDGWLPTIGTAVHAWLETVFTAPITVGRYLVERRVDVGEIGGKPVTGSCDLYDTATATVTDHKVVGSTLKGYRAHGPGPQYRAQAHLYGRGYVRAGYPVTTVMIAFLPRGTGFDGAYFWSEPYDEQVAVDALRRAEGIHLATAALGVDALARLGTADAYCRNCPFFRQDSTDLATGCPGDPAATRHTASNPFQGLVA